MPADTHLVHCWFDSDEQVRSLARLMAALRPTVILRLVGI